MDGAVKLWDIDRNSRLKADPQLLQTSPVFILAVAFHPHLEILASGGSAIGICFWNYRTGELLRQFDLSKLGEIGVIDLAFHPTGKWIASACHEPEPEPLDSAPLN